MTPEVLSFSGRCELSPWNILLPTWRLGYWISSRRWARSTNTMKAMTSERHDDDAEDHERRQLAGAAKLEHRRDARGQTGDDAGEDDERNAVADAARGDLLAKPHQEDRAAGQRDDGAGAEEQAGIGHEFRLPLEADGDAIGLQRGQDDGAVARVLVDLLAALLAFLLQLLEMRARPSSSAE